MSSADLSTAVRAIARMLPGVDREWIVGDLLEDAESRSLSGLGRTVWLTAGCARIAAGLCLEHISSAAVVPPIREIASGVVIEGRLRWRGDVSGVALRGLVFGGAVAMLAFGVDVLVRALLLASSS